MGSIRRMVAAATLGVLAWSAVAVAQAPAPPPDPKLDGARIAFEQLSEADRRTIQEALVWTGDYSSTTTGAFGRRTFEGIVAYQRRLKQAETGIVDPSSLRALKAAGDRAKAAAGFALVTDGPTGIRIGLPQTLLPKRSPGPAGGTRFQSSDGRVTLDTREAPGGEAELKELYERNLAIQTPGRKITYRLSRPDFFVITGETATGRFYTRYAAGAAGLRGFSMGYDKALANQYEAIVVAMSNSFEPFPVAGQAAGIAAAPPPVGSVGQASTVTPTGTATFTGLAVRPRRIVSSAAIEACRDPRIAGGTAKILKVDKASGLALLEPVTALPARTLRLAEAEADPKAALVVVFLASEEGRRAFATAGDSAGANRLTAALQPGAAGGVVTDRAGRIVGMVPSLSTAPRQIAGIVPPAAYGYAGTAAIRAILGPDSPSPAPQNGAEDRTIGAIAAELAPALVSIACPASAAAAAGTRTP